MITSFTKKVFSRRLPLVARIIFFVCAVGLQGLVITDVVSRTVDNYSLLWWFVSLVLLTVAYPYRSPDLVPPLRKPKNRNRQLYFLAGGIIVLALGLRIYLMTDVSVFHNDEYISSYFSYSLGGLTHIDWFGTYPVPHDWIWRFPVLYFFFQKVFFNLFGVGTLQMRLSIIPYIVTVFVTLFLITKRLFSTKAALLAIALLAVFAPDLYLARWSLHFISSTALFMVSVYLFILSFQDGKKSHFVLLGSFLGLCYLTYYSSYLAAPLIGFYLFLMVVFRKIKWRHVVNYGLTALVFLFTLAPFFAYARVVYNFFIQRTDQVRLIGGSWSPYLNTSGHINTIHAVKENALLALKSLYRAGVGGNGGYWFGHQALLSPTTVFLLAVGLLVFLGKSLFRRDINRLFVLSAIVVVFVAGVVLTSPPPALHRLSLAFPFVVLVIAVVVVDMVSSVAPQKRLLSYLLAFSFCFAYVISNFRHFGLIRANDAPDDPDYPAIQEKLEQANQEKYYISAFATYGMGGILYIRSGGRLQAITTSLEEILTSIIDQHPAYIVLHYPSDETIGQVMERYPQTTIVGHYRTHALLKIP